MMQAIGIVVFALLLIIGSWLLVWINAMLIAGEPVRQILTINWHSSVLRHTQWPDRTPPPCTLMCSCGQTWEVAK